MLNDFAGKSPISLDDWPDPQQLPDELAPVAPFNIHLLPDSFGPWIKDIAERMHCPADFAAIPAMVSLAGIVGRKIGIRPKRVDDWLVIPNLWGAIVGRPGQLKTPAMREPLSILERLEREAKSEFDTAMQEHEECLLLAEATEKVRKDELKKAVRDETATNAILTNLREATSPVSPVRRRYKVNDFTVEKLGELLNENPNGLTLFRDELTGLLRALDKHGQESARAFLLEAWNGDGSFTYDRIGRGTVDIPCAIVSLIGGIQPGPLTCYLRQQSEGAGDDGLLQRIQLLVWPDAPRNWKNVDREPDRSARQEAFDTYFRLDNLEAVALGAERSEEEHVPHLHFDGAAQERFDIWRSALEHRLLSKQEHPALIAHLAKYRSLIPSLALLIHLADEPDGGLVTATALSKAMGWGAYLESHARRLYGAMTQTAMQSARRIAAKIKKGSLAEEFTPREVYRHGWTGLNNASDVEFGIDCLVEHGWLRTSKIETGGAPSVVCLVNPQILKNCKKSA